VDDHVDKYPKSFMRPWDNRQRVDPKRTWSGEIVYKRQKHYWTPKDVDRILRKTRDAWDVAPPTKEEGLNLLQIIADVLQNLLNILSFLDPWGITGIVQTAVQDILMRFLGINTEPWNPYIALDLIMAIASRQMKFDVAIKWRV